MAPSHTPQKRLRGPRTGSGYDPGQHPWVRLAADSSPSGDALPLGHPCSLATRGLGGSRRARPPSCGDERDLQPPAAQEQKRKHVSLSG